MVYNSGRKLLDRVASLGHTHLVVNHALMEPDSDYSIYQGLADLQCVYHVCIAAWKLAHAALLAPR
jgi:hypothetical protein